MCEGISIGGNVSIQIGGGGASVEDIQSGLATAAAVAAIQAELSGGAGIAAFPSAAAAANGVSLAEVIRYIQENGTDAILAQLSGAAGLAAFPNAAAPANDVSLAEVLRSIWAALEGTAAGENGITTWPAAAAPGNAVSLAEAVRYIVETLIGTLANSGGTATLGGILGDVANVTVAASLAKIGTLANTGGTATLGGILGDVANSTVAARLTSISQQVARTTAAKSVASVTSANLFTVAGGPVRVLALVGYITTGLEAATNATKLTHTPTGGTAGDLCVAVDVTGAAIRQFLQVPGSGNGQEIVIGATAGQIFETSTAPVILAPGTIALSCTATTTGAISWYIEFEPLAPGATVTAA